MEDSNQTTAQKSGLSYDDTVALVTDVIKQQFSQLKTDIRNDNEKTLDIVNKKLGSKKDNVELRYEGNKRQFQFNSEILEDIDTIKNKIDSSSIEDVEECLDKITNKLIHRNKLIKMADRSEGGWSTVYEYEKGDLAENSDDEKKIRRAESRAVKRKKFLPRRPTDHQRLPTPANPRQTLFRGFNSEKEETSVCWRCGRTGHFRNRCPNNISRFMSQTPNWEHQYPLPVYFNNTPIPWGAGVQKVSEAPTAVKRVQ